MHKELKNEIVYSHAMRTSNYKTQGMFTHHTLVVVVVFGPTVNHNYNLFLFTHNY